jgi:hypothetical protein
VALIFHHIPKAAGSVFSSSLALYYPESEVFRMDYVKRNDERVDYLESLSVSERLRYNLILGHMPFGIHGLFSGTVPYYGFVRDPVKRVLSLCRFIAEREYHYLNPLLQAANGSLAEFVRSGCTVETHNEMVRYFCERSQISEDEAVTEAHLEAAIQNIEAHFPSVGLTEAYDESLVVFSKLYGVPAPYYVKRNQSRVSPAKPPAEAIEAITEANQLDIQLYDYLKKRFDRQLAEVISQDVDLVSRFQSKNRSYGRMLYLLRGGVRKIERKLKKRT